MPPLPGNVIIKNYTWNVSLSFWDIQRMRPSPHLKNLISMQLVPPVIWFTPHSSERMGGAGGQEGGVHGYVMRISMEGKRDDLDLGWQLEAYGRLPAAAWQIEREGKSDTRRLLQTVGTPSTLLIISNWAPGSNLGSEGRQRACASSQWNAEWTLWYIFRCFERGWQAFKEAAASEHLNDSFMTSMMHSGKI